MRRLLRGLSWRWIIGVLAIALLGLAIWLIGPLIQIAGYTPLASPFARFATALLLVLAWCSSSLVSQARRHRTDRQGHAEMAGQEPAIAKERRAGALAEQALLAGTLKAALEMLRTTGLMRGRRLYDIPWYVIIGAAGSGKSTALARSGLRFPLERKLGARSVTDAGGTRYCDWWFTDQAILIDTAGRYTTQDNTGDPSGPAWLGFLAALKRGRPRRPLNGIVIAVSISDLLEQTQAQLAIQATTIKRRIQELNSRLEMELPVYVLFTKCDLIAGFSEFFADLEQADRHRPWGVSFSGEAADTPTDSLVDFGKRYRELLEASNDRLWQRLRHESDPVRRALMYEFPHQMLGLEERLSTFLQAIFLPNQFEMPALLRGIYFVSAVQASNTRGVSCGVLPPALCRLPGGPAASEPLSYFLHDLFVRVIFGEADLARPSGGARRRFRWAFAGSAVLLTVLSASALAALYGARVNNERFLGVVEEKVTALEAHGGADNSSSLAGVLDRLERLQEIATDTAQAPLHHRWPLGWTLDQRSAIHAQGERTYYLTLERELVPAVERLFLQAVRPNDGSDDELQQALRFYLMLYLPEHRVTDQLVAYAGELCAHQSAVDGTLHCQRLQHYLGIALAEDHRVSGEPDTRLVAEARARLAAVPAVHWVYRQLRSYYEAELTGQFSVARLLGSDAAAIFRRRSGRPLDQGVSETFWYRTYHTRLRADVRRLIDEFVGERWIYSTDTAQRPANIDIAETAAQVEALYLRDYAAAWQHLLDDLVIRRFSNAVDGRAVLQRLASNDAPLMRLVLAVRAHTALDELPRVSDTAVKVVKAVAGQSSGNAQRRLAGLLPANTGNTVSLPGAAVGVAFRDFNRFGEAAAGGALSRVQEALGALALHLDQLAAGSDQHGVSSSGQLAIQPAALTELRRTVAMAPPTIRRWFGFIAADTQRIAEQRSAATAERSWEAEVVPFFQQAIAGRYPVDPEAVDEVRLADFVTFFGPGGILDKWLNRYVEPFAERGEAEWRWRHATGLSAAALKLAQRVKRIQSVWFDADGSPQVDFALRPHKLDAAVTQARLDVAGRAISYGHGPVQSHRVRWPGTDAEPVRLTFNLASRGTPVSAHVEGEWGWFRFLDRYGRVESDALRSMMTLTVEGLTISYALQTQRAYNPFIDSSLRDFALPEHL